MDLRWWFHVRIGRVFPLRWNHRVTFEQSTGPWNPKCECGWEMPRLRQVPR
jgi:hypothetical protein